MKKKEEMEKEKQRYSQAAPRATGLSAEITTALQRSESGQEPSDALLGEENTAR